MSRIGKKPIPVPRGVDIAVDGRTVRVKGPRGQMERTFRPEVDIEMAAGELRVARRTDSKRDRAFHGLTRALLANMVTGVSLGFRKTLEIVGVGYRAEKKSGTLTLAVGYSHPIQYPEPAGITITTPNPTTIVIEGVDRQQVGQVAAEIRAVRSPEPYKGKGIRYHGELVRRKDGKAGAK